MPKVDGTDDDDDLIAAEWASEAACWPREAAVCAYADTLDGPFSVDMMLEVAVARAVGDSCGGDEACCHVPLPYT